MLDVLRAGHSTAYICFVPGVMEALKPGKDERHASTEEIPR